MYLGIKKIIVYLKESIIENSYLFFGVVIMAAGTSSFLLPNQLSTGGFAGIATITYYLFNLPVGMIIFILNIPLFVITVYKLGVRPLIRTIVGATIYSLFIDLFDKFTPLTNDRFLACIYGGILIGIGTALVLKGNGTTRRYRACEYNFKRI